MAETYQDNTAAADFDLSQFYQIFFEEAGENLDQMEQSLIDLDLEQAGDEELNAIFRCAHSIKGGAATFGFSDVAELTHHMESLLDKLRRRELKPVPAMVDVLLESADASRSLLARHQSGGESEAVATGDLVRRIAALADGQQAAAPAPAPAPAPRPAPPPPPAPAPAAAPAAAAPAGTRHLDIRIGPLERPELADAVAELFRDIPGLGTIAAAESDRPGVRAFTVRTTSSDGDLLDLFAFHVTKEQVAIRDLAAVGDAGPAPSDAEAEAVPAAPPAAAADDSASFGFFDGAPGAPVVQAAAAATEDTASAAARAPAAKAAAGAGNQAGLEAATIRVSISKVDQLINLVGELVITQAMLAQNSSGLDPAVSQQLLSGLADLDRNTRDLQESVMSIRMIPMSTVFNRFPRMLRDLAIRLGKKVELVTHGEATELDKGLVEKITDPLTHLVRNSCDHGIELPEVRKATGKPEHGTITLAASHQGGSILIEVRDDGRGLSREKILAKARERGMDVSDQMSDGDVWQLIFAPGFSTAAEVTDVSGRGVGMDVVKKNITSLGGSVEIDSSEGYGMKVSVRLPLTLAIMDGMSVRVGEEVYILPLSSVVESFQVEEGAVSTIAQGSQLVKVRQEYMPVAALERIFQVPRAPGADEGRIMVVIESDGSRVALLVNELLGQHQVVVKNLESNYRRVPNISGATILGDGKVALILDTTGLVRRARR
jgi:two-component system chemotaxis sensor kinase CheA